MRTNKTKKEINGIRLLFGYLGIFLILIGLIETIPYLNVFAFPEEQEMGMYFIYPAAGTIVIGLLLYFSLICGRSKGILNKNQAVSLLLLAWICAIISFAIPWVVSGQMDFTRAVFECTSGFTTTGMTTCDITNTSHVFLFSRSLMTFTGGIGLVLILSATISDKSRGSIYALEGHTDQLLPNLAKSARLIFAIYLFLSSLGIVLLWISGLSWFDSINITMSAISTGGFCTNPLSMAGFNNLWAEIIVICLMSLGATNFVFHYYMITGKFKKAFFNIELIVGVIIFIIFGGAMIACFAIQEGDFGLGLRYGIFHYFSSMTGAGFTNTTTPMMQLMPTLLILTFIVMAFGGQSGSTAGGIKHFRLGYIAINIKSIIYSKCVSKSIIKPDFYHKFGEKLILEDKEKSEATHYALIYIFVAVLGGLLISMCHDIESGIQYGATESFFEFLSCLGTTGLSSGVTCATTSKFALWIESFGMFFGRLELTILFVYIGNNLLKFKNYLYNKRVAREEY